MARMLAATLLASSLLAAAFSGAAHHPAGDRAAPHAEGAPHRPAPEDS